MNRRVARAGLHRAIAGARLHDRLNRESRKIRLGLSRRTLLRKPLGTSVPTPEFSSDTGVSRLCSRPGDPTRSGSARGSARAPRCEGTLADRCTHRRAAEPGSFAGWRRQAVDNDGPSASLYANVMELRTNVPQTPTLASFTSSSLHQNPGTNPFSAPMDQDLPPDLSTPPDLLIPAPPPPSYPAPLGPDIKLASDGTARQHFQIRPPAEPQDQQRAQDNGPPPLPKEDYPADEHGSHGTQEPEFPVFQKDYSPLWPAGIPRATVDPGTLTSWGRTHDPRGKTVVTGVPQHEQLQTLSNQPKLGNGTEDAVPIVKNWRHTLGPSYFAAAPEETNFVPTHRRKASDYTNELPSSGSSGELHQHKTTTTRKSWSSRARK